MLEGIEKEQNKPQNVVEVGSKGLERSGGYISEEFLTNLRMPRSLKVYKEMSTNDATIGSILFIFEQMIRKTSWSVRPKGAKRVDKQMSEFVKECMDDMSHTWFDFITEVLSMFVYGWSWHEIVYKQRKGENSHPDRSSKYNDNKVGWAKLPIRSQASWQSWVYDQNEPDRLEGMQQLSPEVSKIVVIPWEKSLHFVTKPNRGNPEGISLLRNAYRAWMFKKRIEEIEGIGIERDLAGLPVMTTPEGVNVFDETDPQMVSMLGNLQRIVSNIRRDHNEGVILPPGYILTLLSTGSRRTFDTNAIINRYDQRIAISMLADIIMLGADKSGSFALADVKKSLLAAALESQLANIASIINKFAIPRLIKLNGFVGYTDYPEVFAGEIETPDMSLLSDAMTKLGALGINFFPNEGLQKYLWDCLGFPESSFKFDTKAGIDNLKTNQEATTPTPPVVPNNNTDTKTKDLPPRATKPKQTDSKTKFNTTYERGGLKKEDIEI